MKVPALAGRLTGQTPAQNGVINRLPAWQAGKIERSAEAFRVRHHLISFPPDENPTNTVTGISDPAGPATR